MDDIKKLWKDFLSSSEAQLIAIVGVMCTVTTWLLLDLTELSGLDKIMFSLMLGVGLGSGLYLAFALRDYLLKSERQR